MTTLFCPDWMNDVDIPLNDGGSTIRDLMDSWMDCSFTQSGTAHLDSDGEVVDWSLDDHADVLCRTHSTAARFYDNLDDAADRIITRLSESHYVCNIDDCVGLDAEVFPTREELSNHEEAQHDEEVDDTDAPDPIEALRSQTLHPLTIERARAYLAASPDRLPSDWVLIYYPPTTLSLTHWTPDRAGLREVRRAWPGYTVIPIDHPQLALHSLHHAWRADPAA